MASDENKTTRFEYNVDGNMTKLIAENPTTGDQVTEWIYGVTVAQGSAVESNALVFQKVYPDSTGATDRVTYTYNRQGQVTTMKDQAGTLHTYTFDKAGRITADVVTFPSGSALDQTVSKITRGYEVRGMLAKVGSFGTGTTPLNEVLLTYNAYGQLARDYQEHNGAVNPASTLNVAYSYEDGSANTIRRTGITYPDGTTTITTAYDGTAADALSRPDALKEGSTTLCTYRYLGAGVFIGLKYDAASDVQLTFEDGGTGDAGDKYTGLDRFGRLIETLWKKGTDKQVHSKYGRNRFGGVVWRKDLTAHALAVTTEDNYYWYDGLYQVKERQRGNLTGTPPSITALQQEEDWTYDATGNWTDYTNTSPAASQTRTNNKANEIVSLTNPGGALTPAYDPVGNMLTLPTAPGTTTGQHTLKWDAWNRLIEVKDGSTSIAIYRYDGAFRRLTTTSSTETRHFYYNRQWRAVEERVEGATIAIDRQYTWGLRNRWDLLRRKRSDGGTLNNTHFCLRDYLDPVAITGEDGLVKERATYDAFGCPHFLSPDYTSYSSSTFGWNWLFHCEFLDTATGLYNYGYRYQNPAIGRWLSRDPIGERGGINLVNFVNNQPIVSVDVLGLYEYDVHTYLTRYLAEAAGFCSDDAKKLARATQALDDTWDDRNALYLFGLCRHYLKRNHEQYHFVSRERLAQMRAAAMNACKLCTKEDQRNRILGEYLHALEDTYAHSKGVGDHDFNYYGGCPTYHGHLFKGHTVDWTWKDVAKANEMAKTVFDELKKLAEACNKCKHCPSKNWPDIKDKVDEFNRHVPDHYALVYGVWEPTKAEYDERIHILFPDENLR